MKAKFCVMHLLYYIIYIIPTFIHSVKTLSVIIYHVVADFYTCAEYTIQNAQKYSLNLSAKHPKICWLCCSDQRYLTDILDVENLTLHKMLNLKDVWIKFQWAT